MNFQFLFLVLAALVCPVGMGAMRWWMHKNMSQPGISEEKLSLRQPQALTNNLLEHNPLLEARIAELEERLLVKHHEELIDMGDKDKLESQKV